MKNINFKYISYIIIFIIIILYLCVQYHNYCIENKLRHTIFEIFDYFNLYKRKDICIKSLLEEEE
jgi:hypothetical protein